ncbi:hypothetical protein CEXT_332461 [Caerostris extrusa]|uniref:Uncharacterized protein n=1 Tax=Caerostris extrusa TaxID=172846 RepID=A0AAV4QXZ7_CAEEX|nr:hypothetical protein CEXT_332461 [Caerostris extrusa]
MALQISENHGWSSFKDKNKKLSGDFHGFNKHSHRGQLGDLDNNFNLREDVLKSILKQRRWSPQQKHGNSLARILAALPCSEVSVLVNHRKRNSQAQRKPAIVPKRSFYCKPHCCPYSTKTGGNKFCFVDVGVTESKRGP